MSKEGFWDNSEEAQSVVSQLSMLKSVIEPVEEMQREAKDLHELFEMASDEVDEDDADDEDVDDEDVPDGEITENSTFSANVIYKLSDHFRAALEAGYISTKWKAFGDENNFNVNFALQYMFN